jgi:TPP-dependent pyruvate/acetoin dehydrogenase alpha subunit
MKQDLWQSMLRIRRIEEAIAQRYVEQEMRCPVHLSIGQEGVAVGVCSALAKTDIVYSNHRSHAHYLAKGGNLPALIAEIYGKATGCCQGRGGSMHIIDKSAGFWGATPIVAGTVPIAVGAAWAMKLQKQPNIVTIFFGDGCFEEGVIHESLNFAAVHKLPVLFVCENNGYSVYSNLSCRQPERAIYQLAAAHGLQSHTGDGNLSDQVQQQTLAAINRIKLGQGPQFLEFSTFRWKEHCGPNDDDDLGYRQPGELDSWKQRCPIKNVMQQLNTAISDQLIEETEQSIHQEIDAAFEYAHQALPAREVEYLEYN